MGGLPLFSFPGGNGSNGRPPVSRTPGDNIIALTLFHGEEDDLSPAEKAFTKYIEGNGNVERLTLQNLGRLRTAFSAASSDDPYSISPVYYGLTGRRSLWKYQESELGVVLFCLHPNRRDTLIVFPPFGQEGQHMLKNFLKKVGRQGMTIEIGRIPANDKAIKAIVDRQFPPKRVDHSPLSVLDWVHPVHTINCDDLRVHQGKAYQALRQGVNHVKRNCRIGLKPINFSDNTHQALLRRLSKQWEDATVEKHGHRGEYDAGLGADYFIYLAAMGRQSDLNLRGQIMSINGEDVAFSIWETPVGKGNIANLFASQVATFGIPHLSTYLIYKTAKMIGDNGGKAVCLGGSEHEKMDRFKRKFVPEQSTQLSSILIEPTR